jgi:hypothetical protein
VHTQILAKISVSGEWFRLPDPPPACETCLLVGTGAFIDGDAIRIEIKLVKVIKVELN